MAPLGAMGVYCVHYDSLNLRMLKKVSLGIAGCLLLLSPLAVMAEANDSQNGNGVNQETQGFTAAQWETIQELLAQIQELKQIVQQLNDQHANSEQGISNGSNGNGSGANGNSGNNNDLGADRHGGTGNQQPPSSSSWYVKFTPDYAGSGSNIGSSASACAPPSESLSRGMSGAQVSALQSFLHQQGLLDAENITGNFGPLTEAAVQQFQSQKDIAHEGDEGHGYVGPRTRAAIAALCGNGGGGGGGGEGQNGAPGSSNGANDGNTNLHLCPDGTFGTTCTSGSQGDDEDSEDEDTEDTGVSTSTQWGANQCPTGTKGTFPNCTSVHGSCNIVNSTSCNGEGTGFDEGGWCTVGPIPGGGWAVVNSRWLRCTPGQPLQSNFSSTCSPNMTGTWPNCVHTNTSTCPAGSTGTYPNCLPGGTPATTGTYRGYLNNSSSPSHTIPNITESAALTQCQTLESNNPTKSVRCTWNGEEIYSTVSSNSNTNTTGTYVGYLYWQGVQSGSHEIPGITREQALTYCHTLESNNPTRKVRCTWNGDEIYSTVVVSLGANQCPTGTTGTFPNCVSSAGTCTITNSPSCGAYGKGFAQNGIHCTEGAIGGWQVVNGLWQRC